METDILFIVAKTSARLRNVTYSLINSADKCCLGTQHTARGRQDEDV